MKIIITELQFKRVVNNILIVENIVQSEKILNDLKIPLDNPEYINLKNTLKKNNDIIYLGFLISLCYDEFLKNINTDLKSKEIIFTKSLDLYSEIKNNKQFIKLLPKKSLFDYKKYNDLLKDLQNLKYKSMYIKFSRLIIDKQLKEEFLKYINETPNYEKETISYYFNNIDGTKMSNIFTKNINRYKTVSTLLNYLKIIVKFHKEGFSYDIWKNKISGKNEDFKIVYDDNKNERILVLTKTWDALKQIGSPSWCIYDSYDSYEQYINNSLNNQYVFLDFSVDNIDYSIIGFTMNNENNITTSHLMDNTHISDIMTYFKKIGVLLKFKTINKEISLIQKQNKIINNIKSINTNDNAVSYYKSIFELIGYDYDFDEYDLEIKHILPFIPYDDDSTKRANKVIIRLTNILIKSINKKLLEIETENLFINTLIHFLSIFQNFKLYYTERDDDDDENFDYISDKFIEINLFDNNGLHEKFLEDYEYDSEIINNGLIKVFIRHKNLKQETFNTFMKIFLKFKTRETIFDIIRQRKEKNYEDYSNIEFVNIKDKKNMIPQIMEKIKKSRKEGFVDLTYQEVKYGVENGIKETLKKLYNSTIPYFMENQVDYESMQIYKELGMIKDLTVAVIHKVDMYGLNSLNSIETSLYQYKDKNLN